MTAIGCYYYASCSQQQVFHTSIPHPADCDNGRPGHSAFFPSRSLFRLQNQTLRIMYAAPNVMQPLGEGETCFSSLLIEFPVEPNQFFTTEPPIGTATGLSNWDACDCGMHTRPLHQDANLATCNNIVTFSHHNNQSFDNRVGRALVTDNHVGNIEGAQVAPVQSQQLPLDTDSSGRPVEWTQIQDAWLAHEVLGMLADISPAKKRYSKLELSDMEMAINWIMLGRAFYLRFGESRTTSMLQAHVQRLGLVQRAHTTSLRSMGILGRAPMTLLGRFDANQNTSWRYANLTTEQKIACIEREWICWMLGGQMRPDYSLAALRFHKRFGKRRCEHWMRCEVEKLIEAVDPAKSPSEIPDWAVRAGLLHRSLCAIMLDTAHPRPSDDNYCEIRKLIFIDTEDDYHVSVLRVQSHIESMFKVRWDLSWISIIRSMAKECFFYKDMGLGLYTPQAERGRGGNARHINANRKRLIESSEPPLRSPTYVQEYMSKRHEASHEISRHQAVIQPNKDFQAANPSTDIQPWGQAPPFRVDGRSGLFEGSYPSQN